MDEYEVISIPISDRTERDFAIMDTFLVEGKNYIAVSMIENDEIQDVVADNLPAITLYEKQEYTYVDTIDLGYSEYGLDWFRLYEKIL